MYHIPAMQQANLAEFTFGVEPGEAVWFIGVITGES
jgi:hypothetical protein